MMFYAKRTHTDSETIQMHKKLKRQISKICSECQSCIYIGGQVKTYITSPWQIECRIKGNVVGSGRSHKHHAEINGWRRFFFDYRSFLLLKYCDSSVFKTLNRIEADCSSDCLLFLANDGDNFISNKNSWELAKISAVENTAE